MFALGAACHLVLHLPCVKKKGDESVSGEIVIAEEEDKKMVNDNEDNDESDDNELKKDNHYDEIV